MGNLTDLATMEALRNVISGETPVKKAVNADNATNAGNVTKQINGKALDDIFEENGTTAKAATNAASATNAQNAASANKVANALTIVQGKNSETYDGSQAKTINIQSSTELYMHEISVSGSFIGSSTTGLGSPRITLYVLSTRETPFTSFEEVYTHTNGNTPPWTGYFERGRVGDYYKSAMTRVSLSSTRCTCSTTGSNMQGEVEVTYVADVFGTDTVYKIL